MSGRRARTAGYSPKSAKVRPLRSALPRAPVDARDGTDGCDTGPRLGDDHTGGAGERAASRPRRAVDQNHNGVSEPQELNELGDLRIVAISVAPRESRKRDKYGTNYGT
jgi:hypothetical protein